MRQPSIRPLHQPSFRRAALASALALALLSPLVVQAQNTTTAAAADEKDKKEEQLEKIVVTGSRIKRSEIEGPAPVFVISAEQIKREGFVTVYDALTTLTEAMGTVESDIQWGQHTVNASPLNLRNMGPGRSLLLINGRRAVDYPLPYAGQSNFANYNNIPAGMVERIEVLSGGASAIYGSDAVAGVINVILKTNYEGDEVKVRAGTSTRGGRDVWDVQWTGGKKGDDWSLTYNLQKFHRGVLYAHDRPYMDAEQDAPRPSWGPAQIAVGFMPSTGLRLIDAETGLRITPPNGSCEQFDGEYFTQERFSYNRNAGTRRSLGTQCSMSKLYQWWTLRNGSEDQSIYLYGTKDFGDNLQAWATLGVWDGEGTNMTFQPADLLLSRGDATWFDPGITSPDHPNGTYVTNAIRRFTAREVNLSQGGLTHSDELAWDFSAGLRGSIANHWDWEASVGRAEYEVDENFPSMLDDKFDAFFLGPQLGTTDDGTPIHRLNQQRWWNPITPDDYRSMSVIGKNKAESWATIGNFSISGDLFEGWAGPIGFAASAEAGRQGYRLSPDPNTLGDNPLYFQTANIDQGEGSRDHYAAGVEFKVPLLEKLVATGAARYDRYDAVLDAAKTTYNFGLEWRPLDNLLLRGSYATSFRAPDMHYVFAESSSYLQDLLDPYACLTKGDPTRCDTDLEGDAQDVTVSRKGSPLLKYETGKSWSYGFVWDIVEGLSLSADLWNINLDHEINDIDVGTVLADESYCRTGGKTLNNVPRANPPSAALCELQVSRVHRDAAGNLVSVESGPINRAQRYVSGYDSSLKYQWSMADWGDFNVGLNYTNLRSLRTREFKADPLPNTRSREPRSKFRGSINWQRESWNATVYADRVGSVPGVRDGGCYPFADGFVPNAGDNCVDLDANSPTHGQQTSIAHYRIGPAITWSTSVGYRFNEHAKLSVFVSNIFDEVNEEKDPYKFDFAFFQDRIFSPVGREVAVEFAYKFD